MKITFWEVRLPTDERNSKILGRYLIAKVAYGVAAAYKGKGWYGSDPSVSETLIGIDDTDNVEEAVLTLIKAEPEYKKYQELKRQYGHLD